MKEVSLAVFLNRGNFLCYLRDDKPTIVHPGYWSLLGGEIEAGESPLQALERELREEVACRDGGALTTTLSFVEKLEVRRNPLCYNHNIYLFTGMTSRLLDEMTLYEGQRLGYFSVQELKRLRFPRFLKFYLLHNLHKFPQVFPSIIAIASS